MMTRYQLASGLFAVTDDGPHSLPAPVTDRLVALYRGLELGVYTVLRTHHHRRFIGLDRHLARLEESMTRIGWTYRLDLDRLRRNVDAVCARAGAVELRVRLDVLATAVETPAGPSREVIGYVELVPPPPEAYANGVATRTIPAIERADPLAKTADFAERRRALEPREPGIFEHLMREEDGRLIEGLSSSLFTVRGGRLATAGSGVLAGITRGIVFGLARDTGLDVEMRAVRCDEVPTLDEVFLCSSSRGIVPIVSIDDERIGDGRPGPHTRALMSAYADYVERNARPAV